MKVLLITLGEQFVPGTEWEGIAPGVVSEQLLRFAHSRIGAGDAVTKAAARSGAAQHRSEAGCPS